MKKRRKKQRKAVEKSRWDLPPSALMTEDYYAMPVEEQRPATCVDGEDKENQL